MPKFLLALALQLSPFGLLAQQIPLSNWTVPPYHGAAATGGLSTMTDVTPGIAFVGVAPCRLVDTRTTTLPNFPAGYGPPALTQGQPRNFDLNSDPLCTGIPAGVEAYSLNVTVTNTLGPGFILIYPQGGSQPTVSTLNYLAGQTVANAAIVPAGTNGGVTVIAGVSGTDLIVDINGYFTDEYNAGVSFEAISATTAPAILGQNTSTGDAIAVEGVVTSASAGAASAAVRGINQSTAGGFGVWGSQAGVGAGVYGTGPGGVGVWGEITTDGSAGTGVYGLHNGVAFGVYGESAAGTGVYGEVLQAFGTALSGVEGITYSTGENCAGVRGNNVDTVPGSFLAAGVRGETAGTGFGVLGLTIAGHSGASGYNLTAEGVVESGASLGFTATVGLNVIGTTQATGVKNFVEPHPSDASKVIRYASLEGNEVGTYFRGRGKFQNGLAVIDVPEDFRIVTAPEGLGVQVTPIGEMATVAVVSLGLDRIVVRASRDVEFFYTVNGVRDAYRDFRPIAANERVFVPRLPVDPMPESYPPVIRQRLISNGTYRPDGTVNAETARRLGWDKEWEKRNPPVAYSEPQ
jgi:hypothetical protein